MNNSQYSKDIQNILKSAKQHALSISHKYVNLSHLLYAMIYNNESNVYKILLSIGSDINGIKKQLNSNFFNNDLTNLSNYSKTHIPLSQNSDLVLRQSIKEAKILNKENYIIDIL